MLPLVSVLGRGRVFRTIAVARPWQVLPLPLRPMHVERIAYSQTARFAAPVLDHLANDPFIREFLELPADMDGLAKAAAARTFDPHHREVLCDALEQQHAGTDIHDAVRSNLRKLRDPRCLTITTGHQLCLFSGPLYVPYKILNAIRLARDAEARLQRPVVPVFWMASEDHDAAEVDHATLNGERIRWAGATGGAVGRMKLVGVAAQVEAAIAALGVGTDASTVAQMLRDAYREDHTLAEATRHFFHALFGRFGLVILDGDDPALKGLFAPTMEEELLNQVTQRCVAYADARIAERYAVQAHAREINLFHLRPGHRSRIVLEGEHYQVLDDGPRWSLDELLHEVRSRPQNFSPNVLLRPVYQESVLPNIAYIGGGGELAYWLQLRWSFQALRIPMPVVFLRTSAATISAKHLAQWRALQLAPQELFRPLDRTKAAVACREVDHRTDLTAEGKALATFYADLRNVAAKADPSLVGSVEARWQQALHGLERVERGLVRAAKRQQAEALQRMDRIHLALFPGGGLQERTENILPTLAAHGLDRLNELLEALDPLDPTFALIVED